MRGWGSGKLDHPHKIFIAPVLNYCFRTNLAGVVEW